MSAPAGQPLAKGQNAAITVSDVAISLELTAPADLSALLVQSNGKVRTDADFVFFNQPTGPGVQLVPGSAGQPSKLTVSLGAVPADIEQIRAVITLDDASSSFGKSTPPLARVSDGSGNALFDYRIDGLNAESIVIALELYRRAGGWKVRAVGQGYSGGFAALVTDHGVSVDDAPAAAPAAAQAAPTPPPAPTPVRAPTPPAPTPPPAATTASLAPTGPPEVSLTKAKPVSLAKGQKVTLKKDGGVALTKIRMGLGWDPVISQKKGLFGGGRAVDIDLDASAVMFAGRQIADVVYYGQLKSKDGSVQHQGDNLTGAGEGDDEVVNVDLTRIPPQVTVVVFIVTSYKGQTFESVQNAFCRLVDNTSNAELARFTLQDGMPYTGMVMAKVFRSGSEWKLQAIGEGITAKHAGEAVPQLSPYL